MKGMLGREGILPVLALQDNFEHRSDKRERELCNHCVGVKKVQTCWMLLSLSARILSRLCGLMALERLLLSW